MKKFIFCAFCSILIFASFAAAQDADRYGSPRLDNLVNELKRQTVDLVDRTSEDLRQRNSNSRADIEAAFLAQQLDASVGFFQEIIRDGRRAGELRDAAGILNDLIRRAPSFGTNSGLWRDAQTAVGNISRELGSSNNPGGNSGNSGNSGGGNNTGGQASGKAFWRGTVDKEVHLVVQRRNIETRTVSGTPYENPVYSFSSALPTRNVTVEAIKKSGRGEVQVIEQPNRDNDYTAVIRIFDDGGGAREYQLEIVWR